MINIYNILYKTLRGPNFEILNFKQNTGIPKEKGCPSHAHASSHSLLPKAPTATANTKAGSFPPMWSHQRGDFKDIPAAITPGVVSVASSPSLRHVVRHVWRVASRSFVCRRTDYGCGGRWHRETDRLTLPVGSLAHA